MHRIVVTGMGTITPVGLTLPENWDGLLRGVSGISAITSFDASESQSRIGGEVKGFDPYGVPGVDAKDVPHMDRVSQLASAAAAEAVQHAGYKPGKAPDPYRVGAMVGSGIGGINTVVNTVERTFTSGEASFARVARRYSPFTMPMISLDTVSSNVSKQMGALGPSVGIASACATGADAIAQSARLIRWGEIDMAITGGSESGLNRYSIAAFSACRALSTRNDDPQGASRPFDKGRDGFVLAEGAGVVVLESLESAERRGAEPLAELVGYGTTSDGYHMTRPHPEGAGAAEAMRQALRMAEMEPGDISYINAHGTSTSVNDLVETQAIKRVFGDEAYKVPISSTKSMTGHMAGAAGAAELIYGIMAIRNSAIPPTINQEEPDPECDLDYVPNLARRGKVDAIMNNSFGFGGHNSCVIARRFE